MDDDDNKIKEKVSNINIYVSFPGVKDIPLFIIFRAFGYESDKKIIYDFILRDLLPCNKHTDKENINIFNENSEIYNNFCNYLEDTRKDSLPIMDKNSSLDYIYSRLEQSLKLSTNSSVDNKK